MNISGSEKIWKRAVELIPRGTQTLSNGPDQYVDGVASGLVFRDSSGEASMGMKSLFMQETVKRGILFGGPVYISYSHTEAVVSLILDATYEALIVLKQAVDVENIDESKKIGTVYRARK